MGWTDKRSSDVAKQAGLSHATAIGVTTISPINRPNRDEKQAQRHIFARSESGHRHWRELLLDLARALAQPAA
jgi:hypothetical protein